MRASLHPRALRMQPWRPRPRGPGPWTARWKAPTPASREDPGPRCPSSEPCWHGAGRRGHSLVWSGIPRGQTRPDSGTSVSSLPDRGAPGKGRRERARVPGWGWWGWGGGVPGGAPTLTPPRPAPRSIQPDTNSRIPTRGSPGVPRRWVRAWVHPAAARRRLNPPNPRRRGARGWRCREEEEEDGPWGPGRGRGPPPGQRPVRAGGCERVEGGVGGDRGAGKVGSGRVGGTRWVWGRRAHLPPVRAAIAGHMTEAVAGMTVRALATRGGRGGDPEEGGRGCRGAGREEGGREGGGCAAPRSPRRAAGGRELRIPRTPPAHPGAPASRGPEQKWRRRGIRAWEGGVAPGVGGEIP